MTRTAAITGAALAVAFAAIAAQQGCTVLTNDALPDDAGLEGGEGGADASCGTCVSGACTGPLAVCLTDPACVAAHVCARGGDDPTECACAAGPAEDAGSTTDAGDAGVPEGGAPDAGQVGPRVDAEAALRAAYACDREQRSTTCATSCTGTTAPPTLGACDEGDAGATDAGATDAGDLDAGATDAGATDAAATDAAAPSPGSACAACAARSCATETAACAAGSACEAYLACAYACTSAACVDACAPDGGEGPAAARALAACTITSCRGPCGF